MPTSSSSEEFKTRLLSSDVGSQQNMMATPEQQASKNCSICQQLLPRHLFSKKEFRNPDGSKCHSCRRNQTAERCKQPAKPPTKQGRKADSGLLNRRPNNHGYCNYLDKLFSLNCFKDVINLDVFHSAKDISESTAAIQAAIKHGLSTSISNAESKNAAPSRIKCLCIGDGSTPRTAVLASYWKQWTSIISIDPQLNEEWNGINPKGVRNLMGFSGTLEEFLQSPLEDIEEGDRHYDNLILLCVHSHARLIGKSSIPNIMARYNMRLSMGSSSPQATTTTLDAPVSACTLVSLPCCPKFRSHGDVGRSPDISYEDDCVFSACRKVEIWNFPAITTTTSSKTIICQDINN